MPLKVSGVKYVLAELSKISPAARLDVNKNVRAAAKPLVKNARGFVPARSPLTNWNNPNGEWGARRFNSSLIKRGIGFTAASTRPNRKGFSYVSYFYNKSAAGAIYETAGRKNPMGQPWAPHSGSHKASHSANPKAGQQFITALGSVGQGKMEGRAMFRAWNDDHGKVFDAIVKTYTNIVDKFNKGAL